MLDVCDPDWRCAERNSSFPVPDSCVVGVVKGSVLGLVCVCGGLLVGLRVREIGGLKIHLKCLLKEQRTTLNPFSFHLYRVVPSLEGGEGNFHDVMGTGCYLLSTPPSLEKVNSEDSTV